MKIRFKDRLLVHDLRRTLLKNSHTFFQTAETPLNQTDSAVKNINMPKSVIILLECMISLEWI